MYALTVLHLSVPSNKLVYLQIDVQDCNTMLVQHQTM